jgi:hypothetical protein
VSGWHWPGDTLQPVFGVDATKDLIVIATGHALTNRPSRSLSVSTDGKGLTEVATLGMPDAALGTNTIMSAANDGSIRVEWCYFLDGDVRATWTLSVLKLDRSGQSPRP